MYQPVTTFTTTQKTHASRQSLSYELKQDSQFARKDRRLFATTLSKLSILVMLCVSFFTLPALAAESVSMIALIANPDRYQGKQVLVSGYLTLEFEGKALYLHADDFANSQYKNGLWVDMNMDAYQQYNRQYIMVEGEFDASDKGHMDLWSGSLKNIERVLVAPKPK